VPADQLLPSARALATTILENGPLAVRAAKEVLELTKDADLPVGLKAEVEAEVRLFATADRIEGMTAFLQRRKPVYQGR